ncbi:uncharacterized protein LAJ45_03795 [Morchella importuna]|uniref:uncharacterized protein n=1 Tax=Morchella importuna TaxID=1174673 RepID=UPI001E8E8656|nr:uncharacterized protein LAJ45_03795 [Morchella importuna]KAH8152368.1 hypothetical protein LAJ45_03795 [Morchella importuna]
MPIEIRRDDCVHVLEEYRPEKRLINICGVWDQHWTDEDTVFVAGTSYQRRLTSLQLIEEEGCRFNNWAPDWLTGLSPGLQKLAQQDFHKSFY